jgi:hypothetical protein
VCIDRHVRPANATGETRVIPSLGWPLSWLGLLGFACVVSCIGLASGDLDAVASILVYGPTTWAVKRLYYDRRIAQREAWRQARFLHWLRSDLPAPQTTDWAKFERDAEKAPERVTINHFQSP